MKLRPLTKTTIICNTCHKKQEFCVTGMPLSGLCTLCRKKLWRKDNPIVRKPECFCTHCNQKIGKNSRTFMCKKCRLFSKKNELTEYSKAYCKERYKNDILFMMAKRLRSRLSHAVRELTIENRQVSSIKHLNCSPQELKIYLESLFEPGMTWANYGSWHIDHIVPLSSAKLENDLYALVAYTNLQPLWAKDNLKKGAKLSSIMSYNDLSRLDRSL